MGSDYKCQHYDSDKAMIPDDQPKRYFSLPALGFILASLLLAGTLAFITWHNLDREERLMETFLLSEGQTLIRAFEAGARTSMMMGPRMGNLSTLVEETAREETIAYILILDENGQLIAAAGEQPKSSDLRSGSNVLETDTPLTRTAHDSSGKAIFEVAKAFSPINAMPMRMGMMKRPQNWCGTDEQGNTESCRLIIYLGLYTTEFDEAREEDIKQSLILLGTLFLLGSGGLYGVFLSHKSQVAKAALENMELYTNNVIHSMPAGLISIDNERRIVSANGNALELFGCSHSEMLGKTFQQLIGAKECSLTPLLLANKEFNDQPMECPRRDGESIPLKVSASHLRSRDGSLRGMVLILRDQREIRAMEEALERSRRHAALGRMAAGIAHEVRNPLGTLRGFAQYFARTDASDEKAKEYADLMVGEVDRLNRTVSALLQFSRSREPEKQGVDLCGLMQKAVAFVQADADNQQVQLNLNLSESPVKVMADPDLLQQVLLNLLQNSLAATPENGVIELGVQQDEEGAHFWVRDSGNGLSAEEQSQMFDPFFTTKKDGTGLGLAVVQQIVEQHKGSINVESEAGQGSRISVILPQEDDSNDKS
jgi:two-component system sensor histidine kinase HydH